MSAVCARPGCGKPLVTKDTGRPARYCSTACRVAASKAAASARGAADVQISAAGTKLPQRASGGRLLCPADASHGRLLDWPTERWAFYCGNQAHDGYREVPRTRAFFTTTEAETGELAPAPRPGPDSPTASDGGGLGDQGRIEAPVADPGASSSWLPALEAWSPRAEGGNAAGSVPPGPTRAAGAMPELPPKVVAEREPLPRAATQLAQETAPAP